MLYFISKKIRLALYLTVLSALLSPLLTQAEPYGTGNIASKRAEEQRAALAKKAAKKQKEAEEQKATDAQQKKAVEDQKPADDQLEKPVAQ